jgi:alanine racemase
LLQPEALIDLNCLAHNYSIIQKKVGKSKVMAVVKANAYGHGAAIIAKSLSKNGVHGFCVALVEEAQELIDAGVKEPILHLGSISKSSLDIYNAGQVRCTISSIEEVEILENSSLKNINVHIKVDTGMGRLGFDYENIKDVLIRISNSDKIYVEGLYSHFATADSDIDYMNLQLDRFKTIVKISKTIIAEIKFFHIANSAAILKYKDTYFNMVRPGITLYGISPLGFPELSLQPILTLKSKISLIKNYNSNRSIGYGRLYKTKNKESIAVLQIGYADGIPIKFSNKGSVEINNELFPIVGQVSMDLITIKSINKNLFKGQDVIIWGGSSESLRLENIAKTFNMIPYELLTGISKRVIRRYIGV